MNTDGLRNKIRSDLKRGRDFEKIFMERMGDCRLSPEYVDIEDHIDVIHNRTGDTFDIKGGYKGNHFVWLEFMNVNGKDGWMKGKAKYIAFYLFDDFYIVDRVKLYNWCKKTLPNEPPQYDKRLFYKPYRRRGRRDILFKVKVEDITSKAEMIL